MALPIREARASSGAKDAVKEYLQEALQFAAQVAGRRFALDPAEDRRKVDLGELVEVAAEDQFQSATLGTVRSETCRQPGRFRSQHAR
jgi:hypothetical protein